MTLSSLAGAWAGTETLSDSPWSPGGLAHGRHAFALGLDGKVLLQDYVEERDGAVALTGHGVLMHDTETDDVLWFWFDSIGFPPLSPSRGRWNGATLTLHKETPRGVQRATFSLAGDRLEHRIEVRLGDATEFATLVTATYARETDAPPARTTTAASARQTAPAPANASSLPAS
ncbi:hypothetical protein DSM104299_04351 [Baekduia alba]|uniref:hypothetical protein n=1 Tax=Baekduia alba TaxID=2997333 RepID=UPI00233FFAB0|nr:hypothetical protein [Baekduia alba]WCB95602.1 hypothetical protein DSM104299_04351 [Baekduia alba]